MSEPKWETTNRFGIRFYVNDRGEWTREDYVDGEWVPHRLSMREGIERLMFWRWDKLPACRTYWGSHGCRRRRGHRLPAHRCSCGEKMRNHVEPFGEDTAKG